MEVQKESMEVEEEFVLRWAFESIGNTWGFTFYTPHKIQLHSYSFEKMNLSLLNFIFNLILFCSPLMGEAARNSLSRCTIIEEV